LLQLVEENLVTGWDDPRMPTIAGLRRRGFTPESIRAFCKRIGVTKFNGLTDIALLEYSIREDLNKTAARVMAVLRPIKVVLTNIAEGHTEEIEAINNPEDPGAGSRKVPFSRAIYIEQDDFMEVPPKKYFRLTPNGEVRLRYVGIIKCNEVIKDASGAITELRCALDPETRPGQPQSGRKVKGTIHWVSAGHALNAEVRLYDRLFKVEDPAAAEKEGGDFKTHLNPVALEVIKNAKLEPSLGSAKVGARFQFERLAYFIKDKDSTDSNPVFNRTVTLRDSWVKDAAKG